MRAIFATRRRRAVSAMLISVPVVHAAVALAVGSWNPGTWPWEAWTIAIADCSVLAVFAWLIFESRAEGPVE